ncbi:hypothetical protein K3G63_00525 [Hymenobacter sp. HSC-4F20]|uniref:hypothetical protein n=1 Tax=Hymenobacter sp. HSC-4F20 TaxID=2864135 RepID=UPI001C7382D0|nr:hypothetical protein [Hymenobacter sp. HSC-4F20]MBX0288898.1 hypothetical protein [Hymenobacter sp. HSC-4F20]
MAEYQVKSMEARTFTLLAEAAPLGELKYMEWYSFKAALTLADGTSLRVEPKGFWGTTIEVKDQEAVLLSFTMHWNGNIVLKSKLGGENRALVLKNQSLMKNTYVLQDKHGQELLTIQPDFKWSTAKHDYAIRSTELFETFEARHLLILVAIHCTNYYMAMSAGAVATMVAAT